jgi:hypothetical protein
MKMNYFTTTAKIISRFGNAWLIRRADGKHELAGGSDGDYTAAKEWVSLFAHDIAFSRPNFALALDSVKLKTMCGRYSAAGNLEVMGTS